MPPSPAPLDAADPLAHFREFFHLPKGGIYLDGNSLGAMPKTALAEMKKAVEEEWAEGLISSWNTAGWFELPLALGSLLAPIIGCAPDEAVVCDTVSINIFKVVHAALALRPGRNTIVAEYHGFPTDLYMLDGIKSLRPDLEIRLEGRDADTIEALIDENTACVLVNQADYRTGVVRDMAALNQRIASAGALSIWDLCHSAGAMPVELNATGADFAIGCTYKYLNGGPGAPAFIFAAKRHHNKIQQPLRGWWSHRAPFAFASGYEAAEGISAFQCSTQPMLSMRAVKPALEMLQGVDWHQVRAKSMALTDYFIACVEARCEGQGLTLAVPRDAAKRGSQVTFKHSGGLPIMQALISKGVVGDFRAPDNLRFGFAPLYLSFKDASDAADIIADVLKSGIWREPKFSQRGSVT